VKEGRESGVMKNKAEVIDISIARGHLKDPMAPWYDSAWVRRHRLEYAIPETVQSPVLFSPRLVPILKHPRILERGEEFARLLLSHRFFTYADFTSTLEREAVNVVTQKLARRQFWCELPSFMYLGAGRIYTDEGFHAQESDEILGALSESTGIDPVYLSRPQFILKLERLLHGLDPRRSEIAIIGFAIVSETLISSILADIPSDPLVVPCVRDFVREHAKDEGKHHAYFSNLLKMGWPGLSVEDQEFLGPLMAQFVRWFLDPDHHWLTSILADHNFGYQEIDEILAESYPESEVSAVIRDSARHSIAKFEEVGMLQCNRTADAFEAAGLISDEKFPPLPQELEDDHLPGNFEVQGQRVRS
jgi:hypothetical protein